MEASSKRAEFETAAGRETLRRQTFEPIHGRSATSATTAYHLLRQLVDAAAALGRHVERLEGQNAGCRQIAAALERLR